MSTEVWITGRESDALRRRVEDLQIPHYFPGTRDKLEAVRTLHLSDSSELLLRLRWLAILSARLDVSLASSGGVHTAIDAIKAQGGLVAAPAGYGKSVLVSHWADSVVYPVAWISLDKSDSDLTQFLAYPAAAVHEGVAAMLDRVSTAVPDADLRGVMIVEKVAFVADAPGTEMLLSARVDAAFGPGLEEQRRFIDDQVMGSLLQLCQAAFGQMGDCGVGD